MSGGTWDHLTYKLAARAEEVELAAQALRFLGAIEHELDYGEAGDSCLACAKLRTLAAIAVWFDDGGGHAMSAIAVARDGQQNQCERCQERKQQTHKDI